MPGFTSSCKQCAHAVDYEEELWGTCHLPNMQTCIMLMRNGKHSHAEQSSTHCAG